SDELHFSNLTGNSTVYFDERLVPHVFADNESDAYFIQGYLHARFRLWQMEMQAYAAAGRVSEIAGVKTLQFDRQQRRLGMVYAAEKMLKEVEANPVTKMIFDQYTAGVNAYIESLDDSNLPLEYKLLGYRPEKWTNLKIALFAKQMGKTLGSNEHDLGLTFAKNFFNDAQLKILFPQYNDSIDPVIPAGTMFEPATVNPVKPADADSAYINNYNIVPLNEINKPNPSNGSNNWAVSGSRTKSGKPILANDPHLDLSLPSVWYEMQMHVAGMNVYGVSFPGNPGIIIGFNEQIAWGITSASNDVRDYYEIKFRDQSKTAFWFNNSWKKVDSLRVEHFTIKGQGAFNDTVAYIDLGPVTYDGDFHASASPGKAYAVRWMVHEPSNEANVFYRLNHAKSYSDFTEAISGFTSPALNFVFASDSGDVALWHQGKFPARWQDQGLYIMPYTDNRYAWQGIIPQEANPHMVNPSRGYVSSANQVGAAANYPYFMPGMYDLYRGIRINRQLEQMTSVTAQDMMQLQKDNYDNLAATILPLMLRQLDIATLDAEERKYADSMSAWNYMSDPELLAPTIFKIWFDSLETFVWHDELQPLRKVGLQPNESTLAEALLHDSAFSYIDDMNTKPKENLRDAVTTTFRRAIGSVQKLEAKNYHRWGAYKNTSIYHLLGQQMLPFARQGLAIGGGRHVVNAMQHNHGPSWRMVVELTSPKKAWVIYPGGQSGNPGSRYYDNFINDYAAGKYYEAFFMEPKSRNDKRIRSVIAFTR
ncbi:MAG: penicillin acylase family protein, partial [Sphingobacteriales bacterium]